MKVNLFQLIWELFGKKLLLLVTVGFIMVNMCLSVNAEGGLLPEDPMVRITTPPIDKNIDEILNNVSREVSQETGIEEKYITYYWQTFDSVYHDGEKLTDYPVFVDLYVPGFFNDDKIGTLMTNLAESLAKNTGIDKKWVFIYTHFPGQGQVYMNEEIQIWDDYKGNDKTESQKTN